MRFNHVFHFLLVLCVLSAFVLPARYTESARPRVSALFTPVAAPSRTLVSWATGKSGSNQPIQDPRPADEVYKENEDLRYWNATLSYQVAELKRMIDERANVGEDLSNRCTAVAVLGPGLDLGTRDSLSLRSGSLGGLQDGMYVLHDRDVVGTLVSGKGGAQVRLVTDQQTKIQARLATFRKGAGERPATRKSGDHGGFTFYKLDPTLLVGLGGGKMICRNLAFTDVEREGVKVGDWAVVDDPDWPPELRNRRIGVVKEIRKTNRMMAEIEIRPEGDLSRLREVMVLTKKK